jgi:hypothetical protein
MSLGGRFLRNRMPAIRCRPPASHLPLLPQQDTPGLDPELEAALRAALADAGETFHDPVVHEAVEDVRRDVANISKYRDNPSVMAAFRKLLEVGPAACLRRWARAARGCRAFGGQEPRWPWTLRRGYHVACAPPPPSDLPQGVLGVGA